MTLVASTHTNARAETLVNASEGFRVLSPIVWDDEETIFFACLNTSKKAKPTSICRLRAGGSIERVAQARRPVLCKDVDGERMLFPLEVDRMAKTAGVYLTRENRTATTDEPKALARLLACQDRRSSRILPGGYEVDEIRDIPGFSVELGASPSGSYIEARGPDSVEIGHIAADWPMADAGLDLGTHSYRASAAPEAQSVVLYPALATQQRRAGWKDSGGLRVFRVSRSGQVTRETVPWNPIFAEGFYELIPLRTGFIAVIETREPSGESGVWRFDGAVFTQIWRGSIKADSASLSDTGEHLVFTSLPDDYASGHPLRHNIVKLDLRVR